MKRTKRKSSNGITLIALVITIIVLLILAGVSIATLSGDNGILDKANVARERTKEGEAKERVDIILKEWMIERSIETNMELEEFLNSKKNSGELDGVINNDDGTFTIEKDGYEVQVSDDGIIVTGKAPEYWRATTKEDTEWYGYTDIGAETPTRANVNAPKLTGQMTPIKYVGDKTQTGSKWANAITADGSMWVWIPRYAYRIKEEYYHKATAGEIEVAFIDINNQFLNKDIDSGEITEDPAEQGAGQEKWLVHPAFTANEENGGGFGNLEGLWVGKFEATGTSAKVSVRPGVTSLREMTINEQFKAAQNAKYGEETVVLGSHMAKNSEWGVTVYLAHSKYGTNGQVVEKNTSCYTGGASTIEAIYTTNKTQSTTRNATGVYDLVGGTYEHVASYANNGGANLSANGGINAKDLYGADDAERSTSTEYKTVYPSTYGATEEIKGDAIYETSDPSERFSVGAWFGATSIFPDTDKPFFERGGLYAGMGPGGFGFYKFTGQKNNDVTFRPVLAF